MQKDGQRLPGKRGIMLNLAEWQTLAGKLDTLQQALDNNDIGTEVQLTHMRKACISDFRKVESTVVDVREWYEKDGELKPGQKGLALTTASFRVCSKDGCPSKV